MLINFQLNPLNVYIFFLDIIRADGMDPKKDRRFIENIIPIKEIGFESAREKNIHQGHISTLHTWWARRPLSSSRTTAYASLIPENLEGNNFENTKEFIIKLAKWENIIDKDIIKQARTEILSYNNSAPPRVIDPFGGGGSIPLEAMRLGCDTYSNDYNPVAVLIQKCTLEYPQKYGKPKKEWGSLQSSSPRITLMEDVNKWGKIVSEEAKKELEKYYPNEKGLNLIGYYWLKAIPCPNPSCNCLIPLTRDWWLSKKTNRDIALYPYSDNGALKFKIVGDGYEKFPSNFDPSKGTISKGVATCSICGYRIEGKITREYFKEKKWQEVIGAVIYSSTKKRGKLYRTYNNEDLTKFKSSEEYLTKKIEKLKDEWGFNPVPDEPTPESKGKGAERAFTVRNYGLNEWGDLFNSRQKLVLITLIEKILKIHKQIITEGNDPEYAKAIISYLALVLSKFSTTSNSICRWNKNGENVVGKPDQFGTLEMKFDYPEINPFMEVSGSYINHLKTISNVTINKIENDCDIHVTQNSATSLPFPDNYFDAVFTDPPYYDNIPYSYLSDYFYVWLKRILGDLYPELFSTPLTPKTNEIVVYSNKEGGYDEGVRFFEKMLYLSFCEMYRVLKHNGIGVIVYAHKTTAGWEKLINSLNSSGFLVTASWPITTEMKTRIRAIDSASLSSSIYIVVRKKEKIEEGYYKELKEELKLYLSHKMDNLWEEGIIGPDFFIAAIGSSLEIFGKYKKVVDYQGNTIKADKLLEDVRKLLTDYAIGKILHNGFSQEISKLTLFYILWRWSYGEAKVPYDDARKLGQSVGIEVDKEWGKDSFIVKDKEFVRVIGPSDRGIVELDNSQELIHILHNCLLYWEKGRSDKIVEILSKNNLGDKDLFYRVAQAISETLPMESKEKKLLEGFLSGKDRLKKDIFEINTQRGMKDYLK